MGKCPSLIDRERLGRIRVSLEVCVLGLLRLAAYGVAAKVWGW
jgi:hypothetical protein